MDKLTVYKDMNLFTYIYDQRQLENSVETNLEEDDQKVQELIYLLEETSHRFRSRIRGVPTV